MSACNCPKCQSGAGKKDCREHCEKRREHCESGYKTLPPGHPCHKAKFDFIMVGGGTAGLSAVWSLTNNKRTSVLVLESGMDLSDDPVVNSASLLTANDLTLDPKYARVNVSLKKEVYSDGNMLGGSSGHNQYCCVRGSPDVYNEWAILSGNQDWSYANMLPLFKSMEHFVPNGTIPNPAQRGLNGRLYITQEPPLTDSFSTNLAAGFGVPIIEDYNSHPEISPGVYANLIGVVASQNFITPAQPNANPPVPSYRVASYNSYLKGIPSVGLPPIVDENNIGLDGRKLVVKTLTSVSRIIFEGKKAVGVEVNVTKNNTTKVKILYARKGIILSAGSLHTPSILQRSGVGDAAILEPLGIEVVYNNPNVGLHLINHYGPDALIKNLTPGSGPPFFKLNESFTDLNKYLPPGPRRIQCFYVNPGAALFPAELYSALNLGRPPNVPNVAVAGLIMQPKSRGSVKIRSTDPAVPPLFDLNNWSDSTSATPWTDVGSDAFMAVSYLKTLQDVAVAQGGGPADILFPPNSHYPAPYGPAPSDALLYESAKTGQFITFHACGTCRMGRAENHLDPKLGSVVDGKLKVHGLENLYIADNSICPLTESGNTSYQAYAIGLKLAQFLGHHHC